MNIRDLVLRLENGVPDRKLDVEIATLCSGLSTRHFRDAIEQIGVPGSGWKPSPDEWPLYTSSVDAARSLLPWEDHPGATFTSKTIQSGLGEFYHFVEFTWPSTERQGRARTEPIATCICALLAIEETERQLAPYREKKRAARRLSICVCSVLRSAYIAALMGCLFLHLGRDADGRNVRLSGA